MFCCKFLLLFARLPAVIIAWTEWKYETQWSATDPVATETAWSNIWGLGGAPSSRRGHSLVAMNLAGRDYLVLFGGRDNNQVTSHVPKTYNVVTVSLLVNRIVWTALFIPY